MEEQYQSVGGDDGGGQGVGAAAWSQEAVDRSVDLHTEGLISD